ncbi:MAG: hypothetical protein K6F52_08045 [Clostridia bacterium]|nr:hypothetical protein [Clostridia bacterium]
MCQRKIRRKTLCLLTLILAVAMLFCGCDAGKTQAGEEAPEKAENGNAINSPVEISYLIQNPIEIDDQSLSDDNGDFSYTTVKISGLADTALQKKINERLKNAVNDMKNADPPAYRGIKAKLGENPKITSEYVHSAVEFNSNNILSVSISRNASCGEGGFSEMKTLNINLATGEDIALGDLFCDDIDYLEYINKEFYRQLKDSNSDEEDSYERSLYFLQTKPFGGISENQKYYLNEYTGDVVLVIDQDTPEFDTNCTYEFVTVPVGTNAAYTKRFMSDENIYKYDGPEIKRLISANLMSDIIEDDAGNVDGREDLGYTVTTRYSSKLPEELKERIKAYNAPTSDGIEKLKEIDSLYEHDEENDTYGGYERRVFADSIGGFWYIQESDYIGIGGLIYDPEGDAYNQQFTSVEISNHHTYNPNTLKEMKLKDIFKSGTDVKKIVTAAMRKAVEENDELNDNELDDAVYENLYENITGFYPSMDSLMLSFGDIDKLLDENRVSADVKFTIGYTIASLKYKNLGCDNLLIFDY